MMEAWMDLAAACWRRRWLRPLSLILWAGFGLVILASLAFLVAIVGGIAVGIVGGVLNSHPSPWGWTAVAAVLAALVGAPLAALSMSPTRHGIGVALLVLAAGGIIVPAGKAIVDSSKPHGFCVTHRCIDNFDEGRGSIVQCADGMWSHSGGLQGACSWHGGE
jgi:hypothetical protein